MIKKIKKVVGLLLLTIPFIFATYIIGLEEGWIAALKIWGMVLVLLIVISTGIFLLIHE